MANEPKLVYPRQWLYKIIGYNVEDMSAAIRDLMQDNEYLLVHSNKSRKGKYCSMNLTLQVFNEKDRDEIYQALKSNPSIKIVM
ncbi:MAG: DUF493 domain-containing protein [Nitrospinae bacterium]|nr:DUF493 domain-containing protein [Nitrospinota bacterium]